MDRRGAPRYQFVQSVFNFTRGGSTTGSGVSFSSTGGGAGAAITIDCWDDAHQDPVLPTTTNSADISLTDGLWTEFHYVSGGRPFPSVFAGSDEYENHSLSAMRFYATSVPNGDYAVYANLYTEDAGRNMRYYYGYSPTETKRYYVDTTGGSGGATEHTEYSLGSVTVTDNTFSLYAQDADMFSGAYPVFGWAWIRLVPVPKPGTTTHYITALHSADETLATGTMRLPGIALPPTATAVAVGGDQPLVAAASSGAGHAVQWGSYDWMSHAVLGPVHGLDDLVWRSLAWAAHKPFVMQALPSIATMRVDDADYGPFDWVGTASQYGFKPWLGLDIGDLSEADAATISAYTNSGQATASIHSFTDPTGFYFNVPSGPQYSDSAVAANFARGRQWLTDHDITSSKFVVPHYYEFGTNVFAGLQAWGVQYVGTVLEPGRAYSYTTGPWLQGGPYRSFESGVSGSSAPLYYADFLDVPGHPEWAGQFFNCVTEIRDDNNYEWYPSNDVASTIGRGTRQLTRAFDSRALGTLFTHQSYIQAVSSANWGSIMQGISANIAGYGALSMTMDDACQYVRAFTTSSISSGTYAAAAHTARTVVTGSTDVPTVFSLFTQSGGQIDEQRVAVPAFAGSTQIVSSLGGGGADVTPPQIFNVSAGEPAAANTTVSWATDEAATSQVEYGLTTAYGSATALDATLVTGHAQLLTGLSANTVYHYRVLSRDAAGNLATGTDATYTTAAPTLSIDDISMTEGNTGSLNAVFTVSLSAPSSVPVSVSYATADGTALAGSDYTAASGALVFAPGVTTQTVSVAVLGDVLAEPDETFAVNLTQPGNATLARSQGVGTIVSDDFVPSISINDVSVTEGNSGTRNAVFTVSLSAPSPLAVSVSYATANGTALAGSDYTATSGALVFAPGVTTRSVSVAVLGDALDEADESFTVNLSGAQNATLADNQGLGTILDDDPTPSLTINDVSVTEGNTGSLNAVFTVSLSAPSGRPVSVAYATTNGTATAGSDYLSKTGTLTYSAGTRTQTVSVSVYGDRARERNEVLYLNLSSAVNATLARNRGTGTILNDD